MGCPTREQLSAYVDGALTPDERAGVEAHLAECDSCAAEVAWLEQVSAATIYADRALPPVEEGVCLAAEDLAEYAEGRGGPGFRGRVERHLAACPECRRIVGYLSEVATATGAAVTPETAAAARAERLQGLWTGIKRTFAPQPLWSAPVYGVIGALAMLLVVWVVLPRTGHPLPISVRESASQLPGMNPSGSPDIPGMPDMSGATGALPGAPGGPEIPPPPPGGPGMPPGVLGGGGPGMAPPTPLPPMPSGPEGLGPPPPPPTGPLMPGSGGRSRRTHTGGGATLPSPPVGPSGPPPTPGGGEPSTPSSSKSSQSFWDMELATAGNLAQSTKPGDAEQARAIYEAFLRHPAGSSERQQDAWANYAKLANKLRLPIDPSLKPEPGRPGVPIIVLEPPIRIGGVDTAVISLYGEPTERSGDPLKGEVLKYGTRGLMFTVQNGKLQAITLLYPSAGSVDGLRVGDSRSAVEDRFGKAGATSEDNGYSKWKYPSRGITFTLKDRIVTRIDVKEPSP